MNGRVIFITVPAGRACRWHALLRDALARRWPGGLVALAPTRGVDDRPASVGQLLALERLLLRGGRAALSDAIEVAAAPDAAPDLVIDLAGGWRRQRDEGLLRPLYDGDPSEAAALAALLCRQAPGLAIVDEATKRLLAQGTPSLEAMDGLTSGLDAVYSRLMTLIEKAIAAPADETEAEATAVTRAPPPALAFVLRNLARQSVRALYHLCCHAPHWRIGWRFTDGPGVLENGSLAGAPWRVMRDRELNFAADPFPITWQGRSGVFYERLDYRRNLGEIYYQPFDGHGPRGEPLPALSAPWHLSYPFLMEEQGVLYMLPEASLSGAVTLYRCIAFPDRWEPVATLLDGIEAADATIFRHGGRYWMTSVIRQGYGGYSDTLALHHAERLFGPWRAHRCSPVLIDARCARPAGNIVQGAQGLYRPAQDCGDGYGRALAIMRIDALDEERFDETLLAHVRPGEHWSGARLHTINRCGRLECIDGGGFAPKPPLLRRWADAWRERSCT
jgi:hypothetical protein